MSAPRRRTVSTTLAASALLAVLLGGCASGDEVTTTPAGGSGESSEESSEPSAPAPSEEPAPSESTPAAGAPVAAELTVAVDDGAGTVRTNTLTCEPAGGDLPDPQAACDAVAAAAAAASFGPLPKDPMCTMIFGGPETATVTGTLAGQPVDAAFNRGNGCEIGRWDSLSALLGAVES